MWIYDKKLQYPVRVDTCNPQLAQMILDAFGGGDGELGAAVRYLSQRYVMPTNEAKGILTDIGTEELAHWELVATIMWKLVKDAPVEKIKGTAFEAHFISHGRCPFPEGAGGVPWSATFIQAKEDPIANLHEDMAAEQKARASYDSLIQVSDDPGVTDALRFLREREIVHFQRFGETLRIVEDYLKGKKYH